MELTVEHPPDGVACIALRGRMDTAGTQEIELPFATAVGAQASQVVIDLSQVTFIASIGIRAILTNAKALSVRGGRTALAGPSPIVRDVLRLAGVHVLLPICDDVASAREALRSAAEKV